VTPLAKKIPKPPTERVRLGDRVRVEPRNDAQEAACELWPRSRVLFLLGASGSGKTHLALGLALREIFAHRRDDGPRPKLMLARPTVTCGESLGYLPGDLMEKISPWLAPFRDVLGSLSDDTLEELQDEVEIESVPVGLLRGRTVSNATLIVDECQNLTAAQLLCVLTRIGHRGRIVLCGDPQQADLYDDPREVPVVHAARKLGRLDTVAAVTFKPVHIVRDPLVAEILRHLT
jgi:phosphate starvation-inducible PhoH-like protein